jgi:copper chaperone CopZ
MTQQTFDIDGLHCGGCVNIVREVIGAVDGVHTVDVALHASAPSTVTVDSDTGLDLAALQRALDGHGEFRIRR